MRNRKQRRIQLIVVGMVMFFTSAALIGYGLRDSVEFFKSPTEIATGDFPEGKLFRVGGLVEEGSLENLGDATVRFNVTDGNEIITVRYQGITPDLFSEGEGVIARGAIEGDVFVAEEILAKHDETYMPREVVDALKEQGIYQGDDEESATY